MDIFELSFFLDFLKAELYFYIESIKNGSRLNIYKRSSVWFKVILQPKNKKVTSN